MAGSFFAQDQHYFVSNKRFCALIEWAMDAASGINDVKKNEYISKMQQGYQELYAPCSDIDLEGELSKDEKIFWFKVFQVVAHQIFMRTIGSAESDGWRPSAIADVVSISRMLQKLTGKNLDFTKTNF